MNQNIIKISSKNIIEYLIIILLKHKQINFTKNVKKMSKELKNSNFIKSRIVEMLFITILFEMKLNDLI